MTTSELESHLGREITQKIINREGDPLGIGRELIGQNLEVGGEGMKGFYDEILPSSINNLYGKYGVKVGTANIPMPPKDANAVSGYPLGQEYMNGTVGWKEFIAANPRAAEEFLSPYHSFDITPQLRDSITNKGQPLYMAAPIGAAPIGAAVDAAVDQEEPVQQRKGGAVNQDAMNMAVWNKQLRKKHG